MKNHIIMMWIIKMVNRPAVTAAQAARAIKAARENGLDVEKIIVRPDQVEIFTKIDANQKNEHNSATPKPWPES